MDLLQKKYNNSKITEIKSKISFLTGLTSTGELVSSYFVGNKIIKVNGLFKKRDDDAKRLDFENRYFNFLVMKIFYVKYLMHI